MAEPNSATEKVAPCGCVITAQHSCGLPGYVYDSATGEHPSLIQLRERDAEALAQGYTEGDVNHYVQPLIGRLRLLERDGKSLPATDLGYYIEQMHKACNAELAWLQTSPIRGDATTEPPVRPEKESVLPPSAVESASLRGTGSTQGGAGS